MKHNSLSCMYMYMYIHEQSRAYVRPMTYIQVYAFVVLVHFTCTMYKQIKEPAKAILVTAINCTQNESIHLYVIVNMYGQEGQLAS